MLYLYAIIERRAAPPALPRGLEDVVPDIRPCRDFSVVTGSLHNAPARDAAAARRHMDVLSALMPHGTVLPARMGAVFPSCEDLDHAVAEMRDTLLADLQRLRGKVELGLSVTDCRPAALAPACDTAALTGGEADAAQGPGLRYIARKCAENELRLLRERANEELAAKVCSPGLLALAAEHIWRALPSSSGAAISVAFLLPREHLDAFDAGVAGLRLAEPRLDILRTGPWPPFSFVSDGGQPFSERTTDAESALRIHS